MFSLFTDNPVTRLPLDIFSAMTNLRRMFVPRYTSVDQLVIQLPYLLMKNPSRNFDNNFITELPTGILDSLSNLGTM